MPALKTEITEITTGLGLLGPGALVDRLNNPPTEMRNVPAAAWARLTAAYTEGNHNGDFLRAWENGLAFYSANDGLRTRTPLRIEWKGPDRPPGYDFLPTDLRVDHVFLVSCKYLSRILSNSSPANLFNRLLADRGNEELGHGWYHDVATEAYQAFYADIRTFLTGDIALPPSPLQLTANHIQAIRAVCAGTWPTPQLTDSWRTFSYEVANASASVWNQQLTNMRRREEMLWRLLRLGPAPYFVLGFAAAGALMLRIGSPWDWRQAFKMVDFGVFPVQAGQPHVGWRSTVREKSTGLERSVEGHVEVRWSHGRFSSVEAKVYLDTAHEEVPGYFPLT